VCEDVAIYECAVGNLLWLH